jgi:phosphoribosyl 1,2-cyclic phosphate phosphodiesterase
MKITFLGTGTSQGVPVIACRCKVCQSNDLRDKRLRSSMMIETSGKTIIIDTGPDFRQQMLREKVSNIDAILFTHEHKDHTAGLDDIRAFNYIKQMHVEVYAEERVQQSLKNEFSYIFAEKKYPGIPQINLNTITTDEFFIDDIRIIPIRVMHYRLPVMGFRIGDFTYITDCNYISEEEKEKIIGSRHIVVTGLRKQKHISHFTIYEAISLIEELSPMRGYITHCSHQLGLYEELQKELPKNTVLAYDGMKIEI